MGEGKGGRGSEGSDEIEALYGWHPPKVFGEFSPRG